jgi:leucyl-tRNA synthetase
MLDTTDPDYYRWTQWIFLKMFEKGLAYESYEPINWCPVDKTGLANEDLEDGKCERCGSVVEKKPMRQWVLRITDYADRMLNDLEKLPHWEESIKGMQRNWIGRSEGCEVNFKIEGSDELIKVFTTRVDTIFGCTYVVLAPENPLVEALKKKISNWNQVFDYLEGVKNKSDLERTDLNKDKSGVKLAGVQAVNPFNGEAVDIYVADYVLNSYGTGAVMAVPAHDERDFEFANKYKISIKVSVKEADGDGELPMTTEGKLVDSGEFSGLDSDSARKKMAEWLEKSGQGSRKINYKLKDWVFSRQRYWGEPIPIIHCKECGPVAVPEKDLPVKLPDVKDYEPSGTGESPLANIESWVNTTCPKCAGPGRRETNTMPQWAGSSWYYLRYIDNKNSQALVDKKLEAHWSPVDFYVGGAEHATRHLIYARFWHKFLFDIGVVANEEPFVRLQHVGLIMGEDGRKMSKRWGNVINPDQVVEQYGADSLRVYEMFMGPFDQSVSWSSKGLVGARRFLDRAFDCVEKAVSANGEVDQKNLNFALNLLHKTIKKVGSDIEEFKFNTAIAQLMIFVNEISVLELGKEAVNIWKKFVLVLAAFAPHLAEELWEMLGEKGSVVLAPWPKFEEKYLLEETMKLAVQVNGKLRGEIEIATDANEEEVIALAKLDEKVAKYLSEGQVVKQIYVKGKLVSFVVKA